MVEHFLAVSSFISLACIGTGFVLTKFMFPGWRVGPTTILFAASLFGLSLARPAS